MARSQTARLALVKAPPGDFLDEQLGGDERILLKLIVHATVVSSQIKSTRSTLGDLIAPSSSFLSDMHAMARRSGPRSTGAR
ncbi:MAG: hypothetical protein U1E23_11820 [Reyranellaceae bacterium]